MELVRIFKDGLSGEDVAIVKTNTGDEIAMDKSVFEASVFVMNMMNIVEKHAELYTSEYDAIESDMLKYAFENIVSK